MKAYSGKIVLRDKVIDGYVATENGIITYVGEDMPSCHIEKIDGYITPGLIDIHNHSSFDSVGNEDPMGMADYNLAHGVTTMLITFYRDIPHDEIMEGIERVREAMKTRRNIYGVHLEGPYLNANFGSGRSADVEVKIDFDHCKEYIGTGLVKQWTCAPELKGCIDLIKLISDNGIIPSIGHSMADYNQVKAAYENGARIVTHVFDATGTTPVGKYEGTLDLTFDEACMLMDDMFYEVICDEEWEHVRKEKLALLIKTVGIDRVVAITDMFGGGREKNGRDITIINGELCGTQMPMDKVVLNIHNAGYSTIDLFKMVALNPAKALGLSDRGEIAIGKRADLAVFDYNMKFIKLI